MLNSNPDVVTKKEFIKRLLEDYQKNLKQKLCPETVQKTKNYMSEINSWLKKDSYSGAKQLIDRYREALVRHEEACKQ